MKKNRIITSLLLSLLILFGVTTNTFAYNTFPGNYTLNGGVGNYGVNSRYYFVTTSAQYYSALTADAVTSWVATTSRLGITTPISILKTTTQSQSLFDIYLITMAGDYNTIAQTDLFVGATNVSNGSNPTQSWGWTKINLNNNVIPNETIYVKQGTIAHEFGHCMGLAHNNANPGTIMCQMKYNRTVNQPQADDCNGINFLY
jgi:hypothetical protein